MRTQSAHIEHQVCGFQVTKLNQSSVWGISTEFTRQVCGFQCIGARRRGGGAGGCPPGGVAVPASRKPYPVDLVVLVSPHDTRCPPACPDADHLESRLPATPGRSYQGTEPPGRHPSSRPGRSCQRDGIGRRYRTGSEGRCVSQSDTKWGKVLRKNNIFRRVSPSRRNACNFKFCAMLSTPLPHGVM